MKDLQDLGLPKTKEGKIDIVGPCSAETETQVLKTAEELHNAGFKIFRAGVWKPRTKPGSFEGNGEKALPWLKKVKENIGMEVAIEVATPEHVWLAREYGIGILWIGARTTSNPFAVQALADSLAGYQGVVMMKNPINPDLDLWIGAIQRIYNAGIRKIAAIHRGFSTVDNSMYRNQPIWQIPIELHRRISDLPIICDPSHMGGRQDLILPLSQYAMDLGYDGLMIESHCNPSSAWSDANQQVTPAALSKIIHQLVVKDKNKDTDELKWLRAEIDDIDSQIMGLLDNRFEVCRKIGQFKKEHNMTVLQDKRYNEVLGQVAGLAKQHGIDERFSQRIFELVHEESVRQQLEL